MDTGLPKYGLMASLGRNLFEGFVVVDKEARVVARNALSGHLLGIEVGMTVAEWHERHTTFSHDGVKMTTDSLPINRALKGETLAGQRIVVLIDGGRYMPLIVNVAPIRDESGNVVGAVALFLDRDAVDEEVRSLSTLAFNVEEVAKASLELDEIRNQTKIPGRQT